MSYKAEASRIYQKAYGIYCTKQQEKGLPAVSYGDFVANWAKYKV